MLDGPVRNTQIENYQPYMSFGDQPKVLGAPYTLKYIGDSYPITTTYNGTISGQKMKPGSYKVTVNFYSQPDAKGVLMDSTLYTFQFIPCSGW